MDDFKKLINQRIAGKLVLITGGTTGIGRATALLLAAHGAKLMVFGRHRRQVDETLSEIMSLERETNCHGMVADVAHPKDIRRVFAMVDSRFGGIDILVNNAAVAYQSIMEGNYENWQYVVQTNLTGYMACCHEAINRMQQHSFSHIINIGSMSADVHEQNSSVYVATKSAVQGFSEALRKEVNPLGIKVTLIEPGATDTDMQENSSVEKQEQVDELKMLKACDVAWSILFAWLSQYGQTLSISRSGRTCNLFKTKRIKMKAYNIGIIGYGGFGKFLHHWWGKMEGIKVWPFRRAA